MHLNRYQALAARTINPDHDRHKMLLHALHGLAAEVGEVHGLFQKLLQGHELEDDHFKKELGDCLWMIAEACTACDFTLEEIAQMNIDKLMARYPNGFEAERSLNRKEGDI